MNYLLVIALFLFNMHETPVAYYDIHLDTYPYEINIEIESSYLFLMTTGFKGEQLKQSVNNYFLRNLDVKINAKPCEINVLSLTTVRNGQLKINGILAEKSAINEISTIQIHNTCFIDILENHINSIIIHQKESDTRGFKMTNERIDIEVEL